MSAVGRPDYFRTRDVTLAAVVAAVGLVGLAAVPRAQTDFRDPDLAAGALVVAAGALLLLRRTWPVAAVTGVWVVTGAYLVVGYFPATTAFVAAAVAAYSAGVYADGSRAVLGGALVATVVAGGSGLALAPTPDLSGSEAAALALLLTCAAVVGDRIRTRRQYLAGLEEGAILRERERAAREQAAVAAERARIARELHDVVAHGVGVIVLHARGAQAAYDTDPAAARRSLALIEATGRQAMAELRTVVGALRTDDSPGGEDRSPQPSLDDVATLVETTRAAGLSVGLAIEGEAAELPAAVGLSAYRIVQEALANVLRHSAATAASVAIRHHPDHVLVQVTDGGGPRPDAQPGGGFGLLGMRQRVELLGGRLEAGPRPDGGFEVLAVLPVPRERS